MATDYEVRSGDSLSKIAARQGISLDRLLQLNPDLKSNPDLIRTGQRLRLSDVSPTSLLDMLPSAPSMDGSGSSYDVALLRLRSLQVMPTNLFTTHLKTFSLKCLVRLTQDGEVLVTF